MKLAQRSTQIASWSRPAWRSGETPSAGVRKCPGRQDNRTIRYIYHGFLFLFYFYFIFPFLLSRCATIQRRLVDGIRETFFVSPAMSAFVSRVLLFFFFPYLCLSYRRLRVRLPFRVVYPCIGFVLRIHGNPASSSGQTRPTHRQLVLHRT